MLCFRGRTGRVLVSAEVPPRRVCRPEVTLAADIGIADLLVPGGCRSPAAARDRSPGKPDPGAYRRHEQREAASGQTTTRERLYHRFAHPGTSFETARHSARAGQGPVSRTFPENDLSSPIHRHT